METFLPPTHPMRSRVLKSYVAALRKLGFEADADEILAKERDLIGEEFINCYL